MKYIGVKGHRGSGKKTVAYLLGQTIEYLVEHSNQTIDAEEFREYFKLWCKDICENEDTIYSADLRHVYFDSFGDAPRLLVSMLIGCQSWWLTDDSKKDKVVVCLNDFSCKDYGEDDIDVVLCSADDVQKTMSEMLRSNLGSPVDLSKEENIYMTLREFILYFGMNVMQTWFGRNVWVKSYKANSDMFTNIFDDGVCRIFSDVKSPSEAKYIREKEGVIVGVVRPGHKKKDTKLSFDENLPDDYKIKIGSNLEDLADPIFDIALKII
jgi:hypothetical protein